MNLSTRKQDTRKDDAKCALAGAASYCTVPRVDGPFALPASLSIAAILTNRIRAAVR